MIYTRHTYVYIYIIICTAFQHISKLAWWCCFHIQLTTQTTKVHFLHGPAKPGSWNSWKISICFTFHSWRLIRSFFHPLQLVSSRFLEVISCPPKMLLGACNTQKPLTWQVSACRSLDEHSSKCETNTSKK